MLYVVAIVIIVFGISLYDYFSSRDVNELTSSTLLFKHRNKRYGAFVMRQSYGPVMFGVMLVTLLVFGITMGAHFGTRGMGDWHSKYEREIVLDTTLLSLETPPKDQPMLPESYRLNADQGNQGKNKSDQEDVTEVKDPSTQPNDAPDNPNARNAPEKTQNEPQKVRPEDIHDDIQAQAEFFRKTQEDIKRRSAENAKRRDEAKKNQKAQTSAGKNQKQTDEKKGNPGAYVTHNFGDRKEINLPVAAFKCEEGGVVVINVVLDAYGNITDAKVAPGYTNKPQCLQEEALMYARRSKFTASARQSQSGSLTYTFKAQY